MGFCGKKPEVERTKGAEYNSARRKPAFFGASGVVQDIVAQNANNIVRSISIERFFMLSKEGFLTKQKLLQQGFRRSEETFLQGRQQGLQKFPVQLLVA